MSAVHSIWKKARLSKPFPSRARERGSSVKDTLAFAEDVGFGPSTTQWFTIHNSSCRGSDAFL